jgi:hypothetical protein
MIFPLLKKILLIVFIIIAVLFALSQFGCREQTNEPPEAQPPVIESPVELPFNENIIVEPPHCEG